MYEGARTTEWEYSTDNGSNWADVVLTGESAEFTKPETLHVRTKVIGTAEQAGYVAASEKVAVSIVDSANIGTKVVIGSVTVVSNGTDGAVEMGDTLTATAVSAIQGQAIKIGENIGTITWGWKADEDELFSQADTTSLTSTYSLVSVADCYDKEITVEAHYQYLAAGETDLIYGSKNIIKTASAGTVGEGDLTDNDFTLSYNGGNTVLQGTTLSAFALSYISGNMTNKLNAEIITGTSGVAFTFAQEKAPGSTGTITVSAKVKGYKAKSFTVPISIKKATPVVTGENIRILKEAAYVPVVKVSFVEDTYTLSELEFCYENEYNADSVEDSDWQNIPDDAFLNKNGQSFTAAANEKLYIRFKQIAATETTGITYASYVAEITVTSAYIGIRSMSVVSIQVETNSQIELTLDEYTLSASGFKDGATCTWYIDDVQVDETSSSFILPSTVTSVNGNYAIRVESVNDFEEIISVTAVVTVSNN
ncbi:MAG: hypothetical protein K6A43_12260 [Treponema sp.]|nr:hypothetical protein [Treponema sp.]